MAERDPMDSTVVGHLLATMKDMAGAVMIIKEDVAFLKAEVPHLAKKEEMYGAISRHSRNPAAHGFMLGLTKGAWVKIGGLITALTGLATAAAAYLSN